MQSVEKRPGKVQLNFVVPEELRYSIKLSALQRGMRRQGAPRGGEALRG